jgi:TIR domain
MSSLAELPEIRGFFSYSRDDDEDFGNQLSALREAIHRDLRAQLGRTRHDFRLWQDQDAIAPGEMWESEIAGAINVSTFFIPIVTPRAVKSKHCKFEFDKFLARERALGRNNLVFPILYITVPALADESKWRDDPVLSVVGERQFVDWRDFRHWTTDAPAYRKAIIDFCASISAALSESWLSPEERSKLEEAAELQRAEEERSRQEAAFERGQERLKREDETRRIQEEAEAQRRRTNKDRFPKDKVEAQTIHEVVMIIPCVVTIAGIGGLFRATDPALVALSIFSIFAGGLGILGIVLYLKSRLFRPNRHDPPETHSDGR